MYIRYMGVSINGGIPGYPNSWMVYNGKSENRMDDLEVPSFQETSI